MRSALAPFAALFALLVGCGGSSSPSTDTTPPATDNPDTPNPDTTAKTGKTYTTAADAPKYVGTAFSAMQILDLDVGVYLDEAALLEALDADNLVFFGEQHETAPVQELEAWLLERMTTRHDDVALAMEHFQHDEQPIIDKYLAGTITTQEFEATSQPWQNYATYWKPLVEMMKAKGRPIVGLNIPDEALNMIYAQFPTAPLKVFNGWPQTFKYDASIAPRPLAAWDATYESYFAGSFDYEAHGKSLGLSYDDALPFFTDLAEIRDETMGYFVAQQLKTGGRVMTVAGDWHVQTGLATPDRAARYAGASAHYDLITTTPTAKLDEIRAKTVGDRKLAHYVLVYDAK